MRKSYEKSSLGKDKDGYYGIRRSVSWSKGRRTVTISRPDRNRNLITETKTTNFGGLFALVLVVLLLASLFSFFIDNGEPKTFYSFLLMMRDVPEFISAEQLVSFFSLGDWAASLPSLLSWALNFFVNLFSVLGFVFKGLIDVLLYLFYFVRWLFI